MNARAIINLKCARFGISYIKPPTKNGLKNGNIQNKQHLRIYYTNACMRRDKHACIITYAVIPILQIQDDVKNLGNDSWGLGD